MFRRIFLRSNLAPLWFSSPLLFLPTCEKVGGDVSSSSSSSSSSNLAPSISSFWSNAVPAVKRIVNRSLVTQCSAQYSSYTYPANNPIEDRHVIPSTDQKKGNWECVAVFDGHGGWQVSEFASTTLLPLLRSKIEDVSEIDELSIDKNIIQAFEEVEMQYVEMVKEAFKIGFGEVAKVGSCVLVALKRGDRLVIANCGDCRAVLGTRLSPGEAGIESPAAGNESVTPRDIGSSSTTSFPYNLIGSIMPATSTSTSEKPAPYPVTDGTYTSTRLSSDHNAREPLEHLNLIMNHPGEVYTRYT